MRPKTRKSVALNVPNWAPKVNQNTELVYSESPVLPKNEAQIRPLLTDLQHDGERIHVWQEVVQALPEPSRPGRIASLVLFPAR